MKFPHHLQRSPTELEQIRETARRWARDYELFEVIEPYRPFVATRELDVPMLHLEDVSRIPFVHDIDGVEQYQHRARVRATTDDLVAAVTPMPDGYEEYCRDRLGLGEPHLVIAEPVSGPLAVTRACQFGEAFDAIARWAADAGRVAIHPYMAIGDVWDLAAKLDEATTAEVVVIGPPPPVLWVANDKWALTSLIRKILDDEWLVETDRAFTSSDMASLLGEYAQRHSHVGLKRTRCASAMGNIVYDCAKLREMEIGQVEDEVRAFLTRTEWEGDEEVLVVEWLETELSPSTQLWLPPLEAGEPVLEGIYEQLLEGPEKVFLGSRPSTLSDAVHREIGEASLKLATALQEMGYTGRCSFDFIITGDPDGEFQAKFTECNGRWGGTSTPMRLMDRLIGTPRPPYHAQDFIHPGLREARFVDVAEALGDDLYDPSTGDGRFVLYNVGPLFQHGKLDVISIGESPEDALRGVRELLPTHWDLD